MTRMEAEKKAKQKQDAERQKGISYTAQPIGKEGWAVCRSKGATHTVLEK